MARRPRIANRFDVSTINGSVVTAKIAGILSTAKITSLSSTRISTQQQRRGEQNAVLPCKEALAFNLIGHPQVAADPAYQRFVADAGVILFRQRHLHAGKQQESTEEIEQPLKLGDQPSFR
ncbi:Uncharacterised protein [Raoultella planticola]|uniref:Uncharacterized protein n=1 Tax=Raoultella planticola TaxID=575 RepID=A0A485DAI7_RAOPL|nr:Uncharacterised protein [Raoultella planticola]